MIWHNLVVMHIMRNVFVSLFGSMMDINRKMKVSSDTHFDQELMGIRLELYAKLEGNNKHKFCSTCYTLSPSKRKDWCKFVCAIKVPHGYSSNITRYISENEFNLTRMKCHYCHIFLQHLLLLTIHGVLKKEVCELLIELSGFFLGNCVLEKYI